MTPGVVDELTFHQYYFRGPGAKANQFVSPSTLDSLRPEIELAVSVARAAGQGKAAGASLGETASSFSGGTPNLSDSFASTFGWIDKLGMSARLGLRRVFRQDLASANPYALFALRDGGEVPTPDFWASLLWRKLMGARVLSVTSTANDTLRAYAHCAAGGNTGELSLVLINLGSANVSSSTAIQNFAQDSHAPESVVYTVYTLSAAGGDFTSTTAMLNGVELRPEADGSPPDVVALGKRPRPAVHLVLVLLLAHSLGARNERLPCAQGRGGQQARCWCRGCRWCSCG